MEKETVRQRVAVIPGSFDPLTIGHYDIVRRAAKIFDRIYLTVFMNSAKKTMFSLQERTEMVNLVANEFPNVTGDVSECLLADYACERNAVVIKGVRGMIDFDYELNLSHLNRRINSETDTLLMPARQEYMEVSSTFVRELLRYERDVSRYVPPAVGRYLNERRNRQ